MSKHRKMKESSFKLGGALQEAEREHIIRVLQETGGAIGGPRGAARRLGQTEAALQSRMQKLGIKREDYIRIK